MMQRTTSATTGRPATAMPFCVAGLRARHLPTARVWGHLMT